MEVAAPPRALPWWPRTRELIPLRSIAPLVVTGTLTIVAITLQWRGSDLPAQLFRADLIRRHGIVLWNGQWYGGHATFDYSVLAPVLSAWIGTVTVGAISSVASAVLFNHLVQRFFGRAALVGSMWFALGTVSNLIIGRVTFGCGLAFALAGVVALVHRNPAIAAVMAMASALASPIAGLGAVLAFAAWALAGPSQRRAAIIAASAAAMPLAAIALLFPTSGWFPYEPWAFGWDLIVGALVALFAVRRSRVVIAWLILFAATETFAFVVTTPLGGNISRFGQFFAGPLLVCLAGGRRRIAVTALLFVPLFAWQWIPAFDAITRAGSDASTHASYFRPVIDYLDLPGQLQGRVEIPSTFRHWEAAYVAPTIPLARGWERQLDIGFNPMFYDPRGFDAGAYLSWLNDNAVQYVALPDVRLDDSSRRERELLLSDLPTLTPVFRDAHWTVWRVDGFAGLASGPAVVVDHAPDHLTLRVMAPGDVVVRVRYSPHWTLDGAGCVQRDGQWTRLSNLRPGVVRLTQSIWSRGGCG